MDLFVTSCWVSVYSPSPSSQSSHRVTVLGTFHKLVKRVIVHPNYNPVTLQNDVALVVMETAVLVSDRVGLACIPPPGLVLENDQSRCIVSAWTKETFGNSPSSYLKMLKLPMVTSLPLLPYYAINSIN